MLAGTGLGSGGASWWDDDGLVYESETHSTGRDRGGRDSSDLALARCNTEQDDEEEG